MCPFKSTMKQPEKKEVKKPEEKKIEKKEEGSKEKEGKSDKLSELEKKYIALEDRISTIESVLKVSSKEKKSENNEQKEVKEKKEKKKQEEKIEEKLEEESEEESEEEEEIEEEREGNNPCGFDACEICDDIIECSDCIQFDVMKKKCMADKEDRPIHLTCDPDADKDEEDIEE